LFARKRHDSYRNPRFSVIVDAKNGEQLQIRFFPCAIVCSKKGQQLHKSAVLCNCCAKKRQTIAHATFLKLRLHFDIFSKKSAKNIKIPRFLDIFDLKYRKNSKHKKRRAPRWHPP